MAHKPLNELTQVDFDNMSALQRRQTLAQVGVFDPADTPQDKQRLLQGDPLQTQPVQPAPLETPAPVQPAPVQPAPAQVNQTRENLIQELKGLSQEEMAQFSDDELTQIENILAAPPDVP